MFRGQYYEKRAPLEQQERVGKLLTRRVNVLLDQRDWKTTNLADVLADEFEVSRPVARRYIFELSTGFALRFVPAGDEWDVFRLRRVSSILHALQAPDDEPCVTELRELYGSRFVYPPQKQCDLKA